MLPVGQEAIGVEVTIATQEALAAMQSLRSCRGREPLIVGHTNSIEGTEVACLIGRALFGTPMDPYCRDTIRGLIKTSRLGRLVYA